MNQQNDLQIVASPNSFRVTAEANASIMQIPRDIAEYSLTIGEASFVMRSHSCKFASNRKVQRLCKNGAIDCYKLSTTRNGQPVSEWLVNETSLLKRIEEHEIKWDESAEVPPFIQPTSVTPSATNGNASQPPSEFGNAKQSEDFGNTAVVQPDAMASPDRFGNASGNGNPVLDQANKGDAMATPFEDGDAIDKIGDTVGETRSLASVLIENAKLTAQLEGVEKLVEEIRDDKLFLRDELKEARAGRKDVNAIAQRMLETLETIATGGKLLRPMNDVDAGRTSEPVHMNPIAGVDENDPPPSTGDNRSSADDGFRI